MGTGIAVFAVILSENKVCCHFANQSGNNLCHAVPRRGRDSAWNLQIGSQNAMRTGALTHWNRSRRNCSSWGHSIAHTSAPWISCPSKSGLCTHCHLPNILAPPQITGSQAPSIHRLCSFPPWDEKNVIIIYAVCKGSLMRIFQEPSTQRYTMAIINCSGIKCLSLSFQNAKTQVLWLEIWHLHDMLCIQIGMLHKVRGTLLRLPANKCSGALATALMRPRQDEGRMKGEEIRGTLWKHKGINDRAVVMASDKEHSFPCGRQLIYGGPGAIVLRLQL